MRRRIFSVLFVSLLFVIPDAAAQEVGSPEFEQFKADLSAFLDEMQTLASELEEEEETANGVFILQQGGSPGHGNPNKGAGQARANIAKKNLQEVSEEEDFPLLLDAFEQLPNWRDIPARLREASGLNQNGELQGFSGLSVNNFSTMSHCTGPNIVGVNIAKQVATLAESIESMITEDIFTAPAHIVAATVAGIAKIVANTVESLHALRADCESNEFNIALKDGVDTRASQTSVNNLQGLVGSVGDASEATLAGINLANDKLDARLDLQVSTRSSQQSLDQAHQKLALVDNNLLALRSLSIRMEIESTLAGSDNSVIGLFLLPSHAGGILETVRDIVGQTIASMIDVGLHVGNAQQQFDRANQDFANGKYKDAYQGYSQAYRSATGGR